MGVIITLNPCLVLNKRIVSKPYFLFDCSPKNQCVQRKLDPAVTAAQLRQQYFMCVGFWLTSLGCSSCSYACHWVGNLSGLSSGPHMAPTGGNVMTLNSHAPLHLASHTRQPPRTYDSTLHTYLNRQHILHYPQLIPAQIMPGASHD